MTKTQQILEEAVAAERAAWDDYELAELSQTRYRGAYEDSRAGKAHAKWRKALNWKFAVEQIAALEKGVVRVD